ncbi:disease resistance protein RPM1-like isoform X1 [Camellia sinensis]|uniref:Uncharacterized protein n=2 Tax=Camellia sinensis TaxID=4442 RepID=A0A4S4E938_CAMSN|nr:disease resistance protein RPM1-like isoform X1 [Camellia sinensis]THG12639.1 hypothetical protein TEA_019205 [Camellia sinensis var. sinensis]
MAEVAVEYLLSKLEVWIVNETNKKRLDEATQIKNEFERIKPFLRYADWKRLISGDSVVETWVLDVVDLAREVENLIDQDWYDRRHTTGLTLSYLWELVGNSFNYSNVNDNNNSSVFSLTLLRKRVCEKLKGVQVKKHLSLFSSSVEAIDERQIRNSKTFTANLSLTHMVGRDTEVTMLKELLLREDVDALHLIAVTGVGGIGKTTLAKTVYECAKRYFDCAAWVFVSDRPARFILRDVFMGFSEKWPEMMHGNNFNEMDEKELARRIFDFLDGKKFLLVLDDLDALSTLEDVKCALPQRCRGKVLMTTQSSGFTSVICKHVVHLEPLLPKDALELLQSRACFQHHDLGEALWPSSVEPVVQKILQICEGLPIAVATVGAMLSKSLLKEPRVLDSIFCMLKEAKEGRPQSSLIQIIFMVSYFSLPPTLKCCFLYCGLFPSHYEIPCKRLIRIWVAEGFIATELLGMTQEEIAKNLLDELIQRNLFEVGRLGANGEVISCKLLCLIRNFIIEVLNKDHFCILSDSGGRNICPLEATRMLSIHGQIKNVFPSLNSKPIRSMLLFSENEQWTPSVLLNSLCNIRFLHVLELKQIPIGALPDEIGNLVLLHYLGLRGTGICNLPSTLQNLRDLQTLDVRDTYVRALPSGFDGLKMLRHVLLADSFSKRVVKLEGNIMFLKDLQTLAGIKLTEHIATELKYLPQLVKLSVGEIEGRGNCSQFSESVSLMKNLNSLTINCAWRKKIHLQISNPLENLEKLRVGGWVEDLLSWVCTLKSLKYLYLRDNMLVSDPISALQHLPNLTLLSLQNVYRGKLMCCDDVSGFPNLKKLSILNFEELEEWTKIEDGSMARLEILIITKCPKLRLPPKGLQNLTNLQMLQMKDMPTEFVTEVREIPRRAGLDFVVVC